MKIQKLTSTNAFIAVEFDDVPSAGISRLARKVLQDGAKLLARSTTYTFASFGIQMGGASIGINAEGDERDAAVAAFVAELRDLVSAGRIVTDPGLGLTEADLAPLREVDPRPAELWTAGAAATLAGQGAVAAAGAARPGGLQGATCALVGGGAAVDAARAALSDAGATVSGDSLDADADVVFVAGKAGVVDHAAAATVAAQFVVPLTPVPVTARAHAELSKAGRIHVPDFLSTAAPLLAAHGDGIEDPVAAVAAKVAGFASTGTGMWMAAIEAAETFIGSWQDELPFGRPLA